MRSQAVHTTVEPLCKRNSFCFVHYDIVSITHIDEQGILY